MADKSPAAVNEGGIREAVAQDQERYTEWRKEGVGSHGETPEAEQDKTNKHKGATEQDGQR